MNLDDQYQNAAELWFDKRDSILGEIVRSFLSHGRKRAKWFAPWRKIDGEKLAHIWLVYGKRGTIFDSEGLNKIAEQMADLIARLHVCNAIAGHDCYSLRDEAEEEAGKDFTEKQWEKLVGGMELSDGQWLVSDYGLKPLESLFSKLVNASTDEEKLLLVDRALNIVHQRSDLAALFISGGTETLRKISMQGGYSTPFESYEDQIKQQRALCA